MFKPIKVIDLELSQPIQDQMDLTPYRAIKILVRLHGATLGYIQLPVQGGRCPAKAIAEAVLDQFGWAIMRHLVEDGLAVSTGNALQLNDLVGLAHPVYAGPFPKVTVAVCTRNRADDLALCLESLLQIDYPNLEILVVDNAPSDSATRDLLQQTYAQHTQVRYVCEPRPGLDWARNRAILEASGEIIAYTDDDVIVDRHWVSALVQVFTQSPEAMAVTGLVVPYELETPTQILFELYGGFGRGFKRQWFTASQNQRSTVASEYAWSGRFGTGANMAYRRSLFSQIGMFDPALDVGTPSNGGGDIEMFFRVLCEGFTLVYEPNAIVRHRHRRDYGALSTQIANNGVGFSAYLVRTALNYPRERWAILRFWIWWLRYWHVERLVNALRGHEQFPRALIVAEFWGYIVGLGRYFAAQQKAAQVTKRFGKQLAGT